MTRLKAAVVGMRGIGPRHAEILNSSPEYELVAVCDRNPEVLASPLVQGLGVPLYSEFDLLLSESTPYVVAIATPNASHYVLAQQAIEAGVRGVYLEKPMTVHLEDARRLLAVCAESGSVLVVNHQRRLLPELVAMRRLIEEGAIGDVSLVRACCAGDFLSDGTHAVDSVRFLLGDPPAEWVAGQIFREAASEAGGGEGYEREGGRRFGHPVEDAAMAVVGFRGGVRAEFMTGTLFPPGRWYQDYEAFGTKGRLWRPSDGQVPSLRIDRGKGVWEAVPVEEATEDPMRISYRAFAESIRSAVPHPLDGATHGFADMEICAAMYESARLHRVVTLPLEEGRFALERM